MTLSTFNGMVAELQAESHNNTNITTAVAQRCISQAEDRMVRRLRVRDMVQRGDLVVGSDTSTTDDDAFFALDPLYLAMKSVEVTIEDQDEAAALIYLDPVDLAGKAANDDTRGQPTHYTLLEGMARLWPVPDQQYTVRVTYYARPEPLSDATQTNLFTERYSDVLYDGACVRMAAYLKNPDEAAGFNALFETGLAEIEAEDLRELNITAGSQRLARLTTDPAIRQDGLNAQAYNIMTDH